MKFTPFGVDIAKHLMQIHFVGEYTGEFIDKLLRQDYLTFFSNREPLSDWHGSVWWCSLLGTGTEKAGA